MKVTREDAKFIVKEINSEQMYRRKRAEYANRYMEIDAKISSLYYPKSPNGKKQMSSGEPISKETLFLDYIGQKDEIEQKVKHFDERLRMIDEMKKIAYKNDDGLVKDYFNHLGYGRIQRKYYITNPSKSVVDRVLKNLKELNLTKMNVV